MKNILRSLPVIIPVLVLSGCGSVRYARVPIGEFGGVVRIEWLGPDKFVFRQDKKRPFYFKRADGETIQPQTMFTDGGSIPRPLWVFKNYSPWGYGPAFIVHDWLFDAHHCHLPDAGKHTVDTSADVLSEAIKTLMVKNPDVPPSQGTLIAIDAAVRTNIARNLWDTGKCEHPPEEPPDPFARRGAAPMVQIYDFDKQTSR